MDGSRSQLSYLGFGHIFWTRIILVPHRRKRLASRYGLLASALMQLWYNFRVPTKLSLRKHTKRHHHGTNIAVCTVMVYVNAINQLNVNWLIFYLSALPSTHDTDLCTTRLLWYNVGQSNKTIQYFVCWNSVKINKNFTRRRQIIVIINVLSFEERLYLTVRLLWHKTNQYIFRQIYFRILNASIN